MGENMPRIFFICLCALLLTGCAGSDYHLPQASRNDIQAAQKQIAENKAPLKIYNRSDKEYRQKLANIHNRLAKNAKPLCQHTGYQECFFQTIYKPEDTVNAYASEGYKITVYRGLLQYLKNDDEIAAVVAHEMGHHLANHNEEKAQNAAAGAAISGVLTAVLLGAANANNLYYTPYQQQQQQETLENMMTVGAHIGALSYSKEQEREADLLATYLLSRANYNLKRAQNIMVVLSDFSGETNISTSAFLNTHPAGIERYVAWDMAIQEVKSNASKLPYLKETKDRKTASMVKEAEPKEGGKGFKAMDMELLRKCPCPVWISRPISKHRNEMKVAVAIDPESMAPEAQDLSLRLLELSRTIADTCNGELSIISCWEYAFEEFLRHNAWTSMPDHEVRRTVMGAQNQHRSALEGVIQKSGIQGKMQVHHVRGRADAMIPKVIADTDIDVLVMGTLGRTGIPGFIIGNTAENVVQKLECSLLALKPGGFVSPVKAY